MRICSPSPPAFLRTRTPGVGALVGTPAPHSYTTRSRSSRERPSPPDLSTCICVSSPDSGPRVDGRGNSLSQAASPKAPAFLEGRTGPAHPVEPVVAV